MEENVRIDEEEDFKKEYFCSRVTPCHWLSSPARQRQCWSGNFFLQITFSLPLTEDTKF